MSQVRSILRTTILAVVLVAFLGILQGGALAASPDSVSDVLPENGASATTQYAYQVEARDEPVTRVLNTIRDRYNVRLCKEEVPKDQVTDRITASDMVQELTELQKQSELSGSQKRKLKLFQEEVDKGQGFVVVGWEEHKIEGEYKADTIPELLDQVLMGSPYGWYEDNGLYVVIPSHGSRLQYLMSIDVENVLLSDVMTKVAAASPASASFTYEGTGMGVTGNHDARLINYYIESMKNIMVPKLRMENEPAIYVLNRAIEAAGGSVIWNLAGLSNAISYMPLPEQFKMWETEYKAAIGE